MIKLLQNIVKRLINSFFVFALSIGAEANTLESDNFNVDDKIQEVARYKAETAVKISQDVFNIKLDWSDESIELVEEILQNLQEAANEQKWSEEYIFKNVSTIYGSYIGEVYKRNHNPDAKWGYFRDKEITEGDFMIALRTAPLSYSFLCNKIQKRIQNGVEDNVYFYYQTILLERID